MSMWEEAEGAVREALMNGEGRASAWYLEHHFHKAGLGVYRLPDDPGETAWLIELKPSVHRTPTWWGRLDDETVCGWTTDHAKAIRFSRAQDAQALIDEHEWTEAIPTDHMWMKTAASA